MSMMNQTTILSASVAMLTAEQAEGLRPQSEMNSAKLLPPSAQKLWRRRFEQLGFDVSAAHPDVPADTCPETGFVSSNQEVLKNIEAKAKDWVKFQRFRFNNTRYDVDAFLEKNPSFNNERSYVEQIFVTTAIKEWFNGFKKKTVTSDVAEPYKVGKFLETEFHKPLKRHEATFRLVVEIFAKSLIEHWNVNLKFFFNEQSNWLTHFYRTHTSWMTFVETHKQKSPWIEDVIIRRLVVKGFEVKQHKKQQDLPGGWSNMNVIAKYEHLVKPFILQQIETKHANELSEVFDFMRLQLSENKKMVDEETRKVFKDMSGKRFEQLTSEHFTQIVEKFDHENLLVLSKVFVAALQTKKCRNTSWETMLASEITNLANQDAKKKVVVNLKKAEEWLKASNFVTAYLIIHEENKRADINTFSSLLQKKNDNRLYELELKMLFSMPFLHKTAQLILNPKVSKGNRKGNLNSAHHGSSGKRFEPSSQGLDYVDVGQLVDGYFRHLGHDFRVEAVGGDVCFDFGDCCAVDCTAIVEGCATVCVPIGEGCATVCAPIGEVAVGCLAGLLS